MKATWYLESVNLFKILCPHRFESYKNQHTFNDYKKTDYIYFNEDVANKVYLINEGKVKIGYYTKDGDEIVKAILSKGDVFGEKAVLGEERRNEFAQSVTNKTSICPIDVNNLQDLMKDDTSFTLAFYKFINFRIKKLERRLELLLFKDCKERLLEFILELCDDYGTDREDSGSCIISHPYTQKDIACLLGVSRPTLNIMMNELKVEGILDFDRKQIEVFNKNKINSFCVS